MLWSPPLRRKRQAIRACAPIWIIVPLCGVSGCMALGQLEQATALVARVPAAAVSTAQTGSEGTLPGTSPSATPRVAAAGPPAGLVAAPKPFSWSSTGKSTGGRPFQIMSAGREGYRTLVVGSVGGDDPIALELVERLARHVHDNGAILGGYETTIIRTLNPDGLANRKHVNQKGVYVNGAFPDGGADGAAGAGESLEVTFLLQQLKELQPQRVIHLRTVRGDKGVIAANAPASSVAREIAEWLNLQLVTLTARSGAGSLEAHLAMQGNSQIITLGIPSQTKSGVVWERYGDSVLNLLLNEDLATRDLARREKEQNSADRRGRNAASPAQKTPQE